MLMDVSSNNNKTLDGFYNDLRRKYPDAFSLATDLGRRNGSLQKLPRLEKTPSPVIGFPPNSPNVASPPKWSPDGFLSKVKYQKTQNNQRKEEETSQQSGNAVIIKDQAIPVPTWARKDYLDAQKGVLFHLPTLRTQIEQNKVELKNKFNPLKKTETKQSSPIQTSYSVQGKTFSDYTTTKSTNDYTTTQITGEYTTTKTSRDYTTAKNTKDYTTTQTTGEYTTTKTSKDYTTTKTNKDYATTQTTGEYTTTKTSRDYTTTKTNKDYATTKTKCHDGENTTTKTSRDYTTTKNTKDYTTIQNSGEYTTTKTSRDNTNTKTTNDFTTTQTFRDYKTTNTSRDYIPAKTTNDYTTTKSTNDYTTTQTTRDNITTKTTNHYITTQTDRDYTSTKPTKDYITTQMIRNDTPTKPTKDNRDHIRDHTTANDFTIGDDTTMKESSTSQTNIAGVKSDPLGTIMKELLPNKPSGLMKDLPKTTKRFPSNGTGGYISDSDSGVTPCVPMKVFRSKMRSPQAPPASRDIIKKFSDKPKRTSEPLKADHSLVGEHITPIVQREDNPVTKYLKSSINFNEKIPKGPSRARVHFEDESAEDAEFRYQERLLLERLQATKMRTNISPSPQMNYTERTAKSESPERSSSPLKEGEKSKITDHQTITHPYRRQPFPPHVAKKVLIEIPRGGLPSRRVPQIRASPAMKDLTNKQVSPRNATSLDGITMNFPNTSHEWREQSQSVTAMKDEERGNHSLSSLETLGSGTTEVSSEVTIMKLEWEDSNSSIGSGNPSRSSSENRDLNLDHTLQNKGAKISFYSKMRSSLRIKKKLNSEDKSSSRHSDFIPKSPKDIEPDQRSYKSVEAVRGIHGKSSPHGAAIRRFPNQIAADDGGPRFLGASRTKKDFGEDVEMQGPDPTSPLKEPYSPMRWMHSLLKKGRAKDYLVRVPSPPTKEASRYRRDQIPDQTSGRVLSIQPDSSRLVELERPKMGFNGLYLTKKNQNGYSGLYVVQLSGAFTSSFPQGILEVGDEILEINRLQAKDLRLDEIYTLLEESSCVLLRVSQNVSLAS
ncbi:uncharacterized protein LOC130291884 [Hyla sarda]|uniref:uncharacterized protein LOC130291884 n=1 Tax=Hyla sarda TaxID=327740 RepID=UPI0024C2F1A0|nr:uncharacterized protein LOC130291884 [Hyla sarda]